MALLTRLGYLLLWCSRVFFNTIGDFAFGWYYGRQKRHSLPPIEDPLLTKTATQLAHMIRSRETRCRTVVECFISRLKAVHPIINAMVHDNFTEALEQADTIDSLLDSAPNDPSITIDKKPFLGLPLSVKEAFAVKGCPNSGGLSNRKLTLACEDAVVVSRLRDSGAIPLCLSNTSELCMWWESSNRVYGCTRNPYDSRRTVGGSSGGEGALLGAGASVAGVGSDIGGSIRMPCHFNGVFGHKATSGMVPNEGQYPNANGEAVHYMLSGPMCRYAQDMLPLLKVMAGQDNSSAMNLDAEVDIRKIRFHFMEDIGETAYTSPVDKAIRERFREVILYLRDTLHCEVEEVKIPRLSLALQLWSAKMTTCGQTSFCTLLADGRASFSPWKELILWTLGRSQHTLPALLLGVLEKFTALTAGVNEKLCRASDRLLTDFQDLFNRDDSPSVFLLPTHPTTAPYHGQALLRWCNFAYTGVFNVLGLPATSIPIGVDQQGLPFSLQAVANLHQDHLTLAVARQLEKAFGGWRDPCGLQMK